MRDALRATGRPIFYSINPGDGSGCPPNSCSINLVTIANMWRIGFDINGSWSSMIGLVDQDANLYSYAAPGHWNDPDMMEVGNGLTDIEGQTHFSMWAILAAPLIAGNDLRSMSAATKATLTNSEVIAVDQDPMGVQGRLVASPGTNLQVWSKTLSGTNTRAVALLNRGTSGPRRSPFSGARSASRLALRRCATSGATRISGPSPGHSPPRPFRATASRC